MRKEQKEVTGVLNINAKFADQKLNSGGYLAISRVLAGLAGFGIVELSCLFGGIYINVVFCTECQIYD